jgi:cytochrome c biogenesis protein CcdA
MSKETIASLILMFISYALIAFVTLDFNPLSWHWVARAVMVIIWFYGLAFLEKNK